MLKRLPIDKRLSVPKAGRTLLANVRRWGKPLFLSHRALKKIIAEQFKNKEYIEEYYKKYSFLESLPLFPDDVVLNLYSGSILLNWLTSKYFGIISKNSSLTDSESWVHESNGKFLLINSIPIAQQKEIIFLLESLRFDDEFRDIFPYMVEVLETSDEIISYFGVDRKSKKLSGIYYTPSDVSDYIISRAVELRESIYGDSQTYTFLDPSCGTGIFLISALEVLLKRSQNLNAYDQIEIISKSLYGLDISPIALQSAAYCLALSAFSSEHVKKLSLNQILKRIGRNLHVCDSTQLKTKDDLATFSPALRNGADYLVSNPPYVKQCHSTSYSSAQGKLFQDGLINNSAQNIYLDFVRLLSSLSVDETGAGGMVVPLSITYNTHKEFRAIREYIVKNSNGSWWFNHFDRTPDSLFGDDVKTRNSIVFYLSDDSENKNIHTTYLMRWSSRKRNDLFKTISYSIIHKPFSGDILPKVGNQFGQALLASIDRSPHKLNSILIPHGSEVISSEEILLRNAKTAYNWLPFEVYKLRKFLPGNSIQKTKYSYWTTNNPEDIYAVFALTQSRISYWLWRVWSDGFHLTNNFIKSLPCLSNLSCLRKIGGSLWAEIQNHMVVTTNAGIRSLSFYPYNCDTIIDEIDSLIIRDLNLPPKTLNYMKDFVYRTIIAGRDDEIGNNPSLERWKGKEQSNCKGATYA
jgi:hypothetical protein